MKKAIMVFSALGDIGALLPYLRNIDEKPLIITSNIGKELLKDEFDNFLILNSKKIKDVLSLIFKIRKLNLDELVDFQCNDRSSLIAKLSKAKKIFNNKGIDTNKPVHDILKEMTLRANIYKEFDFSSVRKDKKSYIVLNMGSSEAWKSKRLPKEKWIEISKVLFERYNLPFYLTGDSCEKEYIDSLSKDLYGECLIFAGKTNLIELKELLKKAYLTVSTDSAAMHISAAQRTPTIGLFGATNWIKSAPFGPWSTVVFDKTYFKDFNPFVNNTKEINENIYLNININEALEKIEKYL